MNSTLDTRPSTLDRLRIEVTVWRLDGHLADLPYRFRRTVRRETRANLYAAATDHGATEAIRRLGSLRRLAADYLTAEYGQTGPRPHYTAGVVCLLLVHWTVIGAVEAGQHAFTAGLLAANPQAEGTFTWPGIRYASNEVTVTVAEGTSRALGGAMTPLTYLSCLLAFVLGGRLWRLLPQWRRRYARPDS
jgi:hypothetical protein